ncbi:MAG: hypothetical protein JXX29_15420 [Deltaproteobacteria bacterium]|nr:hypothetical protein [Deltaproteobacteria bacterium]
MNATNTSAEPLCEDDTNLERSVESQHSMERHGNSFQFSFSNGSSQWRFECRLENGGRITSFRLDDNEILVPQTPDGPHGMYGSTFWTAPENWGWPPPAVIDEGTYQLVQTGKSAVSIQSDLDPQLNIQVMKKFTIDSNRCGMHVDYTIVNRGATAQMFAPWEISRVEKTGLTFYPVGNKPINGVTRGDIQTEMADGIRWYQHPDVMSDDAKLFDSCAENWIAHTDGKLLFVKEFEPANPVADGEGEIEIYACDGYVEVEEQGSFKTIAPGQSSTWRVNWYLRRLPPHLQTKRPSAELVNAVRNVLK